MSRLEEIRAKLDAIKAINNDDSYLGAVVRTEIGKRIAFEDAEWLIKRVEKLQWALEEIQTNAVQHDDDSLSSNWLVNHCKEALAEEDE